MAAAARCVLNPTSGLHKHARAGCVAREGGETSETSFVKLVLCNVMPEAHYTMSEFACVRIDALQRSLHQEADGLSTDIQQTSALFFFWDATT